MDAVADILLEFIHALTHHVIASRVVASRAAAQWHHHVLYGARVKAHDDDAAVCAYVERAFESLRQGVSSGDVHTVGVLVREGGGRSVRVLSFHSTSRRRQSRARKISARCEALYRRSPRGSF